MVGSADSRVYTENRSPVKNQLKTSDLKSYLKAQNLCEEVLQEASSFCQPGLSEKEMSALMLSLFKQKGVKHFFHQPFAWFGERSRFENFKLPTDFMPTPRTRKAGEPFILDAAPVVEGHICDVGLSFCETPSEVFQKGKKQLEHLYQMIPRWFEELPGTAEIWQKVDEEIRHQGMDNCHQKYPFSVLGHRVYKSNPLRDIYLLRFGLISAQNILSHGLRSELLGPKSTATKEGLWALEPHLGLKGFGMKFEELLYFENGKAQWLKQMSL